MSVTYEMKKARIENLMNNLRVISDLNYQKKAWIENSIPRVIDSFEERMCMFFDDVAIDDLLNELSKNPKNFGFNTQQRSELWEIRNKLREFTDKYEPTYHTTEHANPARILANPKWHEVSKCAKKTLECLKDYEVPQ